MNVHAMVAALSVPDGGFSYDVENREMVTRGYAVSTNPECESRLAWPVTADDLTAYVHRHFFSDMPAPGLVFGGWRDPKSGDVFLDVSTVVGTEEDARYLAELYGQRAYFDFVTGQSVSVANIPA